MSNNLNKKTQIILISSLVLILVLHSSTLVVVDAQTTPIKKPIKLGFDTWAPDFLTFVAQEKGYLKKIT